MDRLKEPSSWAGLGVVLMGLSGFFPEMQVVIQGLGMALGAAGMGVPERGRR